jgi:hypothetical protein
MLLLQTSVYLKIREGCLLQHSMQAQMGQEEYALANMCYSYGRHLYRYPAMLRGVALDAAYWF